MPKNMKVLTPHHSPMVSRYLLEHFQLLSAPWNFYSGQCKIALKSINHVNTISTMSLFALTPNADNFRRAAEELSRSGSLSCSTGERLSISRWHSFQDQISCYGWFTRSIEGHSICQRDILTNTYPFQRRMHIASVLDGTGKLHHFGRKTTVIVSNDDLAWGHIWRTRWLRIWRRNT